MFDAPIPLRASKSAISQFAETVAKKLEVNVGSPLEPFVAKLGGKISYKSPKKTENSDRLPESIVVRARNDFTIYLPTMTSYERDRFTIAHELGHLFIHFPLVTKQKPGAIMVATRWVDENNADLVRTEWEANWFAAGFLMPAEEFAKTYNSSGLARTAIRFKVSSHAAEIRAKSLNL